MVRASVNGAPRAEVGIGDTVVFFGSAEQPPGVGSIVATEWDFEGTGNFTQFPVESDSTSITVDATYVFERPGTYFPSFRVAAHPHGRGGAGLPIENGARVRVVVS